MEKRGIKYRLFEKKLNQDIEVSIFNKAEKGAVSSDEVYFREE